MDKEQLANLAGKSKSCRELIRKLGMNPKNGNHIRKVNRMLSEHSVNTSHFRVRKYTVENLGPIVKSSNSLSEVLTKLGLRRGGGTQMFLSRKIKELRIDRSHFTIKKFPITPIKTPEEILIKKENGNRTIGSTLKRAMLESGRVYKCEGKSCTITDKWLGLEIKLQVHHHDGDWLNNKPDNLEFLCPNCHSQTKNYCSGNVARYNALPSLNKSKNYSRR